MSKRKGIVLFLILLGVHEAVSSVFFVENKGVSFSVELPFTEIVIVCALLYLLKNLNNWTGLIFLGGSINLLDRLRFGFVRDYWYVPILQVYNNAPDWFIFIGIIGLCRFLLKTKKY